MSEQENIGWRHVIGHVNLRDFIDIVRGEGLMIGTTFQRAFASLTRLPFGPIIFFVYLMIACMRMFLLAFAISVLGGAIALISVARGLRRKPAAPSEPDPED